jgi:hypothetical protein
VSVTPILLRSLTWGALFALAVAVIGSIIGFAVAGGAGIAGALVGAAMAALFLGLTAVSLLLAGRAAGGDLTSPTFFGIVLGAWGLKLIVFFFLMLGLRGATWLDPIVFFGAVIASVLGLLIVDAVALQTSRVPYVSDVTLPGEEKPSSGGGSDVPGGR